MKPGYQNEEIKTIYENLKLTDQEICIHDHFKHLNAEQIEDLKKTVFNLSLLLLKSDAYGST